MDDISRRKLHDMLTARGIPGDQVTNLLATIDEEALFRLHSREEAIADRLGISPLSLMEASGTFGFAIGVMYRLGVTLEELQELLNLCWVVLPRGAG